MKRTLFDMGSFGNSAAVISISAGTFRPWTLEQCISYAMKQYRLETNAGPGKPQGGPGVRAVTAGCPMSAPT